jgi:NAD(P)-dependent dehydrogenase (short-subunit alcohol dehydrogenase family)
LPAVTRRVKAPVRSADHETVSDQAKRHGRSLKCGLHLAENPTFTPAEAAALVEAAADAYCPSIRHPDIGALAVFLAGDAAATITGACYSIDGGWTAQ